MISPKKILNNATTQAILGVTENIGETTVAALRDTGKYALDYTVGTGKILKDALVQHDEAASSLFHVRPTMLGSALAIGVAAGASVVKAKDTYDNNQVGMPPDKMYTNTPDIDYTRFGDDAGATGDLVFALNRNRRG